MSFATGENVGAYRIVEKLGQGGMATVFQAYHPALDRYVAIKVLHPAFMEDPNFLARFQREARIVARLDHPHIVPVYDFSEHNGHPYLVMRFVQGETLKARMRRGGLDPQEILRIVAAVGEALTYAHDRGVLHRDIKPSNILLTAEGGVYLTDFGLARMAEAGESTLSRDMMAGTPQYISPEQAKAAVDLDARTDVYSLGVVLYELLVGRVPFSADTPYAIVHDHIFTPLPLPRSINPDLSEPLERVLLKALAKEPDARFPAVAPLVAALEAALALEEGSAVEPETVVLTASQEALDDAPPSPPEMPPTVVRAQEEDSAGAPASPAPRRRKGRRWWALAGGAAALCLILAVVGVLLLSGGEDLEGAQEALAAARDARAAGDIEESLTLYQTAAETDPQLVPVYLEAGDLLIELGDVEGALDVLLTGLDYNPEDLRLHAELAGTALLTERWEIAQEATDWLLSETPEDALPHAYDGLLMLAYGEPCEAARPRLETALEVDAGQAWAHYGLALCHLEAGNPTAAQTELERVLAQDELPLLLVLRSEALMGDLDGNAPPALTREFEALVVLSIQISDEGLRQEFKRTLTEAGRAWRAGDREDARRLVAAAATWLDAHEGEIGGPLTQRIRARLLRVSRFMEQAP
jgi:serine/threonine-protein kinase